MAIQTRKTTDGNELQYEVDDKGQLTRASYVDHYGKITKITDTNMLNSLSLAITAERIGTHMQEDAGKMREQRDELMARTGLPADSPAIRPYDQPYRLANDTADHFLAQATAAFSKTSRLIDKAALDPRSAQHGLAFGKPAGNGGQQL